MKRIVPIIAAAAALALAGCGGDDGGGTDATSAAGTGETTETSAPVTASASDSASASTEAGGGDAGASTATDIATAWLSAGTCPTADEVSAATGLPIPESPDGVPTGTADTLYCIWGTQFAGIQGAAPNDDPYSAFVLAGTGAGAAEFATMTREDATGSGTTVTDAPEFGPDAFMVSETNAVSGLPACGLVTTDGGDTPTAGYSVVVTGATGTPEATLCAAAAEILRLR